MASLLAAPAALISLCVCVVASCLTMFKLFATLSLNGRSPGGEPGLRCEFSMVDSKLNSFGIIRASNPACQVPSFWCYVQGRLCSIPVGRSCYKCRKGGYAPLLVPNGYKSGEYSNASNNRRRARFVVRAFRGVSCGLSRGYRFRWFVLTESDESIASGINFGREFHHFVRWLCYSCPDFQYICVEHRQGNKLRRNWHILSYGSDMLPVRAIRSYWLSHFKSTVTGMSEVKDIGKAIKYLVGYLLSGDKFVRSFQSQGWVFRGWVGFSKSFKKQYESYPKSGLLATLALMSPVARSSELIWLFKTGFVSQNYFKGGVKL